MADFRTPMQSYPGLAPYAQAIDLPRNGLRLFYYAAGDPRQPTALLVHGLGDEADTWRHLIAPLSARWQIIAPDLPGFGRSGKPKRAYTLAFLQSCLFELLDILAVQQVLLVGHSLGGMLAQGMALAQPRRASGLALIDGALLTRPQRLNPQLLLFLIPGLGEWLYTRLRSNPQAAFDSLRAYYANMDSLPQLERDFLFQRVNQRVWSDGQRRAYFSVFRHLVATVSGLQKGLPARLAQLHTPTLVLWGEQDRINPPESGQALAQLQPAAKWALIPNAGHMPHQEQPQETVKQILSLVL